MLYLSLELGTSIAVKYGFSFLFKPEYEQQHTSPLPPFKYQYRFSLPSISRTLKIEPTQMRVDVLDYDPNWATQFESLKAELEGALVNAPYLSIEHVGSTSVLGLPAKPILDIDIVVETDQFPAVRDALIDNAGYAYMGEWGIPHRHAFRKADAKPSRNLYVCIQGCQALRNHLTVRDLCHQDPAVRDKYGALKRELASREWRDMDEYCEAKSEVLAWILQKAGMSCEEAQEIEVLNRVAAAP